jgi:hypothetical protein
LSWAQGAVFSGLAKRLSESEFTEIKIFQIAPVPADFKERIDASTGLDTWYYVLIFSFLSLARAGWQQPLRVNVKNIVQKLSSFHSLGGASG